MKKAIFLSCVVALTLSSCSKNSCDGDIGMSYRSVQNSNPQFINTYAYEDVCFNIAYAARPEVAMGDFNRIQIKLTDVAWLGNPAGESYMLIDFWLNNSNIKNEEGFSDITLATKDDIVVVASVYQPNGASTGTDFNPNYGVENTDLRTGFQNLTFSINKANKTISMEFDGLVGVRSNYSFVEYKGNVKIKDLKIDNM